MSIVLDTSLTIATKPRVASPALPQPVLYTAENAFALLNGNDPLKDVFLRCRDSKMCLLKYKPDFPYEHLDESFIIRSPYSKKLPINTYNLNGNKVAYIGDHSEANWGDSVTIPRDGLMDGYTDLASDCPVLIMRLVDREGRESIHLTHVHSTDIDIEVANIICNLRENKRLSPKEIIFSPRSDSRFHSASHDLERFGRNVEVEVIRRKNNSTQALITSDGWCISDERSMTNHSLNSLIAAKLWERD